MPENVKLCECGCGQPTLRRYRGNGRTGPYLRFIHGHQAATNGHRQPRYFVNRQNFLSEYQAYSNAKYRCTKPLNDHWEAYGGRGIKFLFESFKQFLTELGPKPALEYQLDRINNDGHYEPGNVRWTTPKENSANRRAFDCAANLRRRKPVASTPLFSELPQQQAA
jgi:hypothetical protein